MKCLTRIALGIALAACAFAQPTIKAGGVTNAASYISPDLPNGPLARGGFFVVKGTNLGPQGIQVVTTLPFPTQVGGTQVKVTVGGTTVDAYMY